MNAYVAPANPLAINADAIVQSARTVIATEAATIRALEPRIGPEFVEACRLIMSCAGRVVVTGVSELYPDINDEMLRLGAVDDEHLELLRTVGFRSAVVVPLRARGRSLGVMTLVTAESLRRFDQGDLAFAEQLAGRAAVAVDNARLATARRQTARHIGRLLGSIGFGG